MGKVRAKQENSGDKAREKVLNEDKELKYGYN